MNSEHDNTKPHDSKSCHQKKNKEIKKNKGNANLPTLFFESM